jgi:hypothetical protein
MGKKDKATETTTTDTQLQQRGRQFGDLSPMLQGALGPALSFLGGEIASPQSLPSNLLTQGLTPQQMATMGLATQAGMTPPILETDVTRAYQDLLGGGINPWINQAIETAQRPITQQYQEQVQPQLRDIAVRGGHLRGSVREDLEQRGARDYLQTLGDVATRTAVPLFEHARSLMAQAAPGAGQFGQAPFNRLAQLLQLQDLPRSLGEQALGQQRADFYRQHPGAAAAATSLAPYAQMEFAAPVAESSQTERVQQETQATDPMGLGALFQSVAPMLLDMAMPGMGRLFSGLTGGLFDAGGVPGGIAAQQIPYTGTNFPRRQ